MNPEIFTSILAALSAVLGGSASIVFEVITRFLEKKKQPDKEDIAAKIKIVSDSLGKSTAELVEIQQQLKDRITFVEDLSVKAKQAENIASLNKEQINAVNEILGTNLKREGRRSFWQGVLVNFIFFILGAVASYLTSVFLL